MYLLCVCVSRVLTRQKKRSLSRTENIKNTAQCAKKTGAESKCLNTAQSRQTLTWYIKNTAQCAKKTGAESKFLKYSAIQVVIQEFALYFIQVVIQEFALYFIIFFSLSFIYQVRQEVSTRTHTYTHKKDL